MPIARIYAPTKDKQGDNVNYVGLLKESVAQFCKFFGGATVSPCDGISRNKEGNTLEEKISIVESYADWMTINKFKKEY